MKGLRVLLLLVLAGLIGCKNTDNSTGGNDAPQIISVSPGEVLRGQTVDARINGSNFNGVTAVAVGDGIRVVEIVGVTTSSIIVRLAVSSSASPGPRDVSVFTPMGSATAPSAVTVAGNRAPVAAFRYDPAVGIRGTIFHFDAYESADPDGFITGYRWDFGDGATANGRTATHKYNSLGTFTVQLTVTDNEQGTNLNIKNIQVIDGHLPVARFTITPGSGDNSTLFKMDASDSSDSDGRITDYIWDLEGLRRTGKVVQHRFTTTGRVSVDLTVRDDDNLENSTQKSLQITGNPPVARFTVTPSSGSTTTTFRFDGSGSSDNGGQVVAWAWQFGDGASANGVTTQHRYTRIGTFTVQLTVTDNGGAQAGTSQVVRVSDQGPPPPPPPPGGGGQCTAPARGREPHLFRVISADQASKVIVGQFFENVTCKDVFYLCGDVRLGGLHPGEKEYWIGTICEMYDLGNNTFRMHLVNGKPWVSPGETGTYVWPQLDCNPATTCR